MSKKKKEHDLLDAITDEITGMDKITNIKDKIKTYNLIKNKLLTHKTKILESKKIIETPTTNETKTNITDEEFEKKMTAIENIKKANNNDLSLDELVNRHTLMSEYVKDCENYLNNKKTDIVYN